MYSWDHWSVVEKIVRGYFEADATLGWGMERWGAFTSYRGLHGGSESFTVESIQSRWRG